MLALVTFSTEGNIVIGSPESLGLTAISSLAHELSMTKRVIAVTIDKL